MKGLNLKSHQKKVLHRTSPEEMLKKFDNDDLPLYSQISQKESELYGCYTTIRRASSSSPDTLQWLDDIGRIEQEIDVLEAQMSKSGRESVTEARSRRQAVLMSIYQKRAESQINSLNERQALTLLKRMKDSGEIPDEVWREISMFTHLRVDTQDPQWEMVKSNRGLKGVKGTTDVEDARFDAWREILSKKNFYKNLTGWRSHHAETLSPSITASIVCDQLGSYMQHMRGHNRKGGLRNNAMYYLTQARAGGGEGSTMEQFMDALLDRKRSTPYFRASTSHHDFLPGASLYWMKWSPLAFEGEYMKLTKSYSHAESKLAQLEKKQVRDQGRQTSALSQYFL